MNRSLLIVALLCAGPSLALAAASNAEKSTSASSTAGSSAAKAAPQTPYERAVQEYLTAVQTEVKAYQDQLQSATKEATPEVTERYAVAVREFEDLQQAAESLQKAGANQFDPRKAVYERARAEFSRAWQKANAPGAAAE